MNHIRDRMNARRARADNIETAMLAVPMFVLTALLYLIV